MRTAVAKVKSAIDFLTNNPWIKGIVLIHVLGGHILGSLVTGTFLVRRTCSLPCFCVEICDKCWLTMFETETGATT